MAQVPQPYLVNYDFGSRISQAIEGGLQRKQELQMQQAQIAQKESEFMRNMLQQQDQFGKNYLLAKQQFEFEKQKTVQDQAFKEANAPKQIDYTYGGKSYKLTADEIQSLKSADEANARISNYYSNSKNEKISADPRIQALRSNFQKSYEALLALQNATDRFGQPVSPDSSALLKAVQEVNNNANLLESASVSLGMKPSKSLVSNVVPEGQNNPVYTNTESPSTPGTYTPQILSPTAQKNKEAIKAKAKKKIY